MQPVRRPAWMNQTIAPPAVGDIFCTRCRLRRPLICAAFPFQPKRFSLSAFCCSSRLIYRISSPAFQSALHAASPVCAVSTRCALLSLPQLTATLAAQSSARSDGWCSPLFLQQSAGGTRRSGSPGGRRGGRALSAKKAAPRIGHRRCSSSRLHQQAAPGLPEGDEGIAGARGREA